MHLIHSSMTASLMLQRVEGKPVEFSKPVAVVQDADRLDAIGAVGVSRCLMYGGAKHRPLYDPARPPRETFSKEAYMAGDATTVNHFYEVGSRARCWFRPSLAMSGCFCCSTSKEVYICVLWKVDFVEVVVLVVVVTAVVASMVF